MDYIDYLGAEQQIKHVQEVMKKYKDNLPLVDKMMIVLARYPAMQGIIDDYAMLKRLHQ